MAEDSRQIYSSTSIVCCNDALKGVSVGFDGSAFFTLFLFDFTEGGKRGSLIFRQKVPELFMMPIFSRCLSLSFTKVISSPWPRLFALSRDSSIRVVATSNHVLQPFRDRRLFVDVEDICLTQQSDDFLLIGIVQQFS